MLSGSGGGGGGEAEDTQSVVSLSTDGAVAASEAQDSAWDSDTYDDEDDPGYARQPVEDEEWFLLHEIEYPAEEGNPSGKSRRPSSGCRQQGRPGVYPELRLGLGLGMRMLQCCHWRKGECQGGE